MNLYHHELYFQPETPDRYEPGPISFDRPVGELPVVDDVRWSADVTDNSWAAFLVWILLLVVLQAAAWPLVRRVFTRFPDSGWGFGRLVSLSISACLVWYLASLEVIAFRAVWAWIFLGLVIVVAWLSGPLLARTTARRRDKASSEHTTRRNPVIVTSEIVFWAVFLLFLSFRLVNPDSYHPVWGGEKPMEFAHINAILRSAHFPPVDPWYADGYLNYYYYGAYLAAFMFKLTGIPSEIAFNLAQPTFAALLASGAFSVGAALAKRASRSPVIVIGGGLLATVLLSLSGNLIVAARLLAGLRTPSPPLDSFVYWFWDPTRAPAAQPIYSITEFPYFSATYADLHAHVIALPITVLVVALGYALALDSRQVALVTAAPLRSARATLPVVSRLLLLALCLGTLFMTNAWDVPTFAAVAGVAILMATRAFSGIVRRLGGTIFLAALVGVSAYLVALPFTRSYVTLVSEIAPTRDQSLLLAVESHLGVFLLIAPFALAALAYRRARAAGNLFEPTVWALLLGTALLIRWYGVGRDPAIARWADVATVAIVVAMVLLAAWQTFAARADFGLPAAVLRIGALGAWTVTIWLLATERPVLALFTGLGLGAGLLWLSFRAVAERYIAMMIAGASFVAAGTELVYLVDDLSGGTSYRMNTLFKFYNGVWTLLALACAGLLAFALALIRTPSRPKGVPRADHQATAMSWLSGRWGAVGATIGVAAILASLAFPVFSTAARLGQHFEQPGAHRTLNALDWMSYGTIGTPRPNADDFRSAEDEGVELSNPVTLSYDEDRVVIEWFNEEVAGTPVIAEASINPYRCGGSRISIHTGLPVVIGWVRHQEQQRYRDSLGQRRDDLRTLYTTEDPREKQRIIDRYRIEYIVVGDMERHYPTNGCLATDNEGGIAAFSPLVGSDLEVAFTAGDTVVYRAT
ncbi:MAG TPA: DUF2298 domain-containing protein [Thermomicrobiales bacterium]|nr:DUF2298 domain-containing protein [Thermomicrobiales bacterium]